MPYLTKSIANKHTAHPTGTCVIGVYINLYAQQPWEDYTSWFQLRSTVSGIISSCVPQEVPRGGVDYTG